MNIFSRNHRISETADVKAFALKFGHLVSEHPGHLTKRKLRERLACMREELDEFEKAIETQDLAEQADALIDLIYFAKGTSLMLGLGACWTELWTEVQRANMAKVRGMTKRGHLVDCTKPEGWIPPQLTSILERHGYDQFEFCDGLSETVCEALCRDDEEVKS